MSMKKFYLYIISFALLFGACSDRFVEQELVQEESTDVQLPFDAKEGELLIKFDLQQMKFWIFQVHITLKEYSLLM